MFITPLHDEALRDLRFGESFFRRQSLVGGYIGEVLESVGDILLVGDSTGPEALISVDNQDIFICTDGLKEFQL